MEKRLPRKLAAILYADVAGYSRLTGEDEERTHRRLSENLDLISASIEQHQGKVVHYAGDAVLADFGTVTDALTCAAAVQRDLQAQNKDLPDERKVQFRVGVNLGEVIEDRDDIYGDGVNVAARLESLADPGGICISESVRTAVGNKLPLDYEFMGEQRIKNITEPVRAYRVLLGSTEAQVTSSEAASLEVPDKPSIAVLPFDNMSGDPEQEYFADGMTEDLITALSKIRWLFVIARNSTFIYKGQAVEVKQIARELGVRYVLEGSVRTGSKRMRISAQLIDATTGRHVWAERYDREIKDIFDLQDEMTQTITAAVEPEVGAAEQDRALHKPPENLDAWATYQRGLWHMWTFVKDDNVEARRLFRHAQELDPRFAPAYAHESYAHYISVILGYVEAPNESLAMAVTAAKKALALDDKDPVGHFALGRVDMMLGHHDESIAELETALALNPNFAHAYLGLGFALALSGRLEEAAENLDKAMRLSPRDPVLWGTQGVRSLTCTLLGQYEAAADWARKAVRGLRDAAYWPHAILASALGNLGQIEDARAAVNEALRHKPDLSLTYLEKTLPTKEPGGLKPYLDGLRKAGLPE